MNKTILKILISTLILLIGVGAVSAIEQNSTDELMTIDQNDEFLEINDDDEILSVNENNTETLSTENNNTIISISENNTEILSTENNNTIISISENNTEILSTENNNTIISVSNDNDLTTSSPFAKDPQMTQSKTQYKTVYLGKMKFLKKYKSMALNGYKIPSKKNKKAWKKHITYQKSLKKQYKQIMKNAAKKFKKLIPNHWNMLGDVYYKIKNSGKYFYMKFYVKFYRTYNYNPLLNEGWWD